MICVWFWHQKYLKHLQCVPSVCQCQAGFQKFVNFVLQEDLVEKEDKLVAAKNEENAKISALSKLEPEVEPAPVIASEKPTPPPITLRHSYKKGKLYSNISMC